jgi:hypothetical protein
MADSDPEPLRAAFDRLEQRRIAAKQAADDLEWKRQQRLKPPMSRTELDLNARTARDLNLRDKRIRQMENMMKRDYDTFMERFSDHYARLTGATTN